ncbi:hypothetical protein [Gordonia sp. ABSL49_1]|uniref:hypothetical protein n=1 Tax=unclassified Gordonia (in: high G+C Gram-positive bacteria) TaxID=2657482 RepID=UPI001F0D06D8|nr:hypothetical protein [Gordonia sp. ABSL49_1]MCH5642554.1 hypothetical protein [Gordonia sp. ABSL49_1]
MTSRESEPHTEETDVGPDDAASDVQSDPAAGDESGDWTGEGGATDEGPATDSE